MFSGAMQPHGQVVSGKAELRGDFAAIFAVQIDLLEQVAVLLRHQRQQAFEALAENTFVVVIGRFGKLLLKACQSASAGILSAVDIDNGAPENPIEPGRRGFLTFRLAISGQCFYEAFLDDVFGEVRVAQAISRKGREDLEVLQESVFQTRHG